MKKYLVTCPFELNPGLDTWEELPPDSRVLTREQVAYAAGVFSYDRHDERMEQFLNELFGEESDDV